MCRKQILTIAPPLLTFPLRQPFPYYKVLERPNISYIFHVYIWHIPGRVCYAEWPLVQFGTEPQKKFLPIFGSIFSWSVFQVFLFTYLKRERVSLEPVRDGSIKFKFQRDSILSELCAVKVFILECCETKQDRQGRPNPDRYFHKNLAHLQQC